MVVDDHHLLVDLNASVVYLAYADPSHIFIVVNGADQNLGAGVRISFRCRNVIDNGFKQGNHVGACLIRI